MKFLLLVGPANGFNDLSGLTILWTIRHRWLKIARFAFNAYHHHRRLCVRRTGLAALVILSMEGVTQIKSIEKASMLM